MSLDLQQFEAKTFASGQMTFVEKLRIATQENKSLLCVGLDPDPHIIPAERVFAFNRLLVTATSHVACAYKPNLALYEAMGAEGLKALEETLGFIRDTAPSIPIIGDAKRADIGNCSIAYARALFDTYKFDAVTVNPYMGSDALTPFFELERKDRGVFILCHTSNRGAADIQELMVLQRHSATARPLYEVVADLAQSWNKHGNIGLVVGATYPEQIRRVRQICPNMLFLIPGVGFQGGDIAKTVASAVDAEGAGFIISVSRQIMYAARTSTGGQRRSRAAMENMRAAAGNIRGEINKHLPKPVTKTRSLARRGNGANDVRCGSSQGESFSVAVGTGT